MGVLRGACFQVASELDALLRSLNQAHRDAGRWMGVLRGACFRVAAELEALYRETKRTETLLDGPDSRRVFQDRERGLVTYETEKQAKEK